MNTTGPRVLTAKEFAELLGKHPQTVVKMSKRDPGFPTSKMIGTVRVWDRDEAITYHRKMVAKREQAAGVA